MRRRLKNQSGQSMVLTVVFLAALIAVASAVIDVGSWYRTDRQMQATADASALAAAQRLPEAPAEAHALALEYAERNDGGVESGDIEITQSVVPNDTVKVTADVPAPGVFTKLFGMDSVTAKATATARAGTLGSAKFAAPIGVDEQHPDLQCEPLPCFGNPTTLELDKVGPGSFRILNIDGSHGGTSSSVLGEWIGTGLDAYMPLGWYLSEPGSSFNSSHVRDALQDRMNGDPELLFPIYRDVRGGGSNLEYEVVGWVGWHLTGFQIGGRGKLQGWFTHLIWEGIQSETPTDDDFGVRAVSLIE
jgi:hypothetical protein